MGGCTYPPLLSAAAAATRAVSLLICLRILIAHRRAAALQTSLRDKTGVEKLVITRTAPVWTLEWNPSRDESPTLLAIGCWDQVRSQH